MEKLLNRIFDYRVIQNCERDPYLMRWYVFRRESFAIFIHKFVRSDEDRALHDHPWAFIVVPLWRGYIEHSDRECPCFACQNHPCMAPERIPVKKRVWPIIGTRFRSATYRHRVELLDKKPAWSLFFRFKRIREWGFWPKEGFMDWKKWWNDLCED